MIVGIASKNNGGHAHSLLAHGGLLARLHTTNNKMLSEWGFARQVKLAGRETFVQGVIKSWNIAYSLSTFYPRASPNTSFPVDFRRLLGLLYTISFPTNITNRRNRGGACRVACDNLFDDSCDQAGGDLLRVQS